MTTFAHIFLIMKLIAVTTPYFFVEEDKIITELFEEGLNILIIWRYEMPEHLNIFSQPLVEHLYLYLYFLRKYLV